MNVALSAKPSKAVREAAEWLDMREAVEYALERLLVKAVVIDEAQHLMRAEAPQKPVDQLDWLKSITNRTNVLHVLVGNYDLYDFRNLSGQAARRGRDVYFPRYHLETKSECEEFAGALRYLLERVPLTCDVGSLLSHWHRFAEWSIGCIGILRDWVVDTVVALYEEGATTLTLEALCVQENGPSANALLLARSFDEPCPPSSRLTLQSHRGRIRALPNTSSSPDLLATPTLEV